MNLFLFLGPELGKKQDALDAVRKNFSENGAAEEHVFYAGETHVNEIADILRNISLFADSRIIIVKNAELIRKKEEIDLLASCIKNMQDNTALVLMSDEIKLASGLENAVPSSNKQVFYEMFEREKPLWVRQFFKREGYSIEEDAIAVILELVENNTAALKRDCSNLMYFLPKGKTITAEDIEKHLSHNREESSFTLFSRIASGDLPRALESVSVMLAAKESAQGILAGLAWCFRKLADFITLLEESGREPDSFALRKIGLTSPKAKDDYAAAARRYNAGDAGACLAITAKYDLLLRSSAAAQERLLMDRYILSIFSRARA